MSQSLPPKKRTYVCNAETLVFLRERKGWTQQELAAASGYSERLISKAESGGSISTPAIEVLAETLSSEGYAVYWEDLVSDPVAVAKEYIATTYRNPKELFARLRRYMDEDIVVRFAGDPAVLPFAGEFRGLAEVERCMSTFFAVIEAPPNHDFEACHTYLAQGKDVIIWGDSWLHPIGMPLTEPVKICNRLSFRRGKLCLLEDLYDSLHGSRMLDAASLPQRPDSASS